MEGVIHGSFSGSFPKCDLCGQCLQTCPFQVIAIENGKVTINAACKFNKIYLRNCSRGAIMAIDAVRSKVNKDDWKGILIFVEHTEGKIHPVTIELIGKACPGRISESHQKARPSRWINAMSWCHSIRLRCL